MGGVDEIDQNIAYYRIQFHFIKRWSPFVIFMPEVVVQNSIKFYNI